MGIVDPDQDVLAGVEFDFGDGGVVEAEAAEAVEVDVEEPANEGAGAEAVADDDAGLVRVSAGDFLDRPGGPGLHGPHGLSAGHADVGGLVEPLFEQVRPAGEHFLEALSLQFALIEFAEPGVGQRGQMVAGGDGLGGLAGADQVGGIDGVDDLAGEGGGQGFGLFVADFGQGDIGRALAPALAVPDGLAVTDEDDPAGGHGM